MLCVFVMIRRPPRATRTDTLFPYTTLFRSRRRCGIRGGARCGIRLGIGLCIGPGVGRGRGIRRSVGRWDRPWRPVLLWNADGDADGLPAEAATAPLKVPLLTPPVPGAVEQAPHRRRSEERRVGKECVSA